MGGVLGSMTQISTLVANGLAGGIIVVRLLVYKAQIVSTLGKNHGVSYTSTAAIVLESTLVFLLFEGFRAWAFRAKSPLFILGSEIFAPLHVSHCALVL